MKYIVKAVDLSLNIDLQKREHGHASNDKKNAQRESKVYLMSNVIYQQTLFESTFIVYLTL